MICFPFIIVTRLDAFFYISISKLLCGLFTCPFDFYEAQNTLDANADEYLTRLFIKHGNAECGGAGGGESLSKCPKSVQLASSSSPGAGLRTVHTELGQLTLYAQNTYPMAKSD